MAQTFEPVKSRTINAEYSGLAGHSLAVVVRVSVKVEYEYPGAREWVTRAIAAKLEDQETRDSIRGLKVVQADVVLKYQEEHLRWDEMDRAQLGKALGADFVLLVNLTEFRTREPASLYRLQGLMTADVSLYKTDLPERESRVFKCDDIRVINPKDTPGGPRGTVDSEIIREMIKEFAEKVVWKFYRHEEPAEG